MKNSGNTALARLVCDAAAAQRAADLVAERYPFDAAVAAFEGTDGRWNLEINFEQPPDEREVRQLVAEAAGAERAAALTFETVEARDWVAASLSALKPVTAGRFTVHGAHDRGQIAPNRIGIEIEAAL